MNYTTRRDVTKSRYQRIVTVLVNSIRWIMSPRYFLYSP